VSTYWPSSHFVEREFPLLSSRVLSLVFFVFASVLHLFVINICFLKKCDKVGNKIRKLAIS